MAKLDVGKLLVECIMHETCEKNKRTEDDRGEYIKFRIVFKAFSNKYSCEMIMNEYFLYIYENGVRLHGPHINDNTKCIENCKFRVKSLEEIAYSLNDILHLINIILSNEEIEMDTDSIHFIREFEPEVKYKFDSLVEIISKVVVNEEVSNND